MSSSSAEEKNQHDSIDKVDIHDRVMEAYYGFLGDTFMKETQARIHWICAQVKGRKVLDIGCSQGIVPILLAREGCEVVGVDTSPRAIEEASEYLAKEPGHVQENVTYINQDFMSLDESEVEVDTVILSEVLEHLARPHLFVEKAARLLMPTGGRLVVTVPFGINDYIDHKQTFYLKSPYEILFNYFSEVEFVILGKWIGFVAYDPRKNSGEEVQAFGEELGYLEKGFYSLEEGLRAEIKRLQSTARDLGLKYKNAAKELSDNNARYKADCERISRENKASGEIIAQIREKCDELSLENDGFREQVSTIESKYELLRHEIAIEKRKSENLEKKVLQTENERDDSIEMLSKEKNITKELKEVNAQLLEENGNVSSRAEGVRNSITYQIGCSVKNALTVKGFFMLPFELFKLYRTYQKQKRSRG